MISSPPTVLIHGPSRAGTIKMFGLCDVVCVAKNFKFMCMYETEVDGIGIQIILIFNPFTSLD